MMTATVSLLIFKRNLLGLGAILFCRVQEDIARAENRSGQVNCLISFALNYARKRIGVRVRQKFWCLPETEQKEFNIEISLSSGNLHTI
jgi:hypothetical protein